MELEFFPNDNDLTHYYNIINYENADDGGLQNGPNYDPGATRGLELKEKQEHIHDIKHRIRDIIIRNSITEYVVTQDRNSTDTLLIMKRVDGEAIGIFHCKHCAMEFDDEIQLSSHLRMHLFI